MQTRLWKLSRVCLSLSLLVAVGCQQKIESKAERKSISRFDKQMKGDHPVMEKPEPVEIRVNDVPIVNAMFPEEDDTLIVLAPPEEEEIMGPPVPPEQVPLDEKIAVQEQKVDSFEKDAKELEKAVRKKKAHEKGIMVRDQL